MARAQWRGLDGVDSTVQGGRERVGAGSRQQAMAGSRRRGRDRGCVRDGGLETTQTVGSGGLETAWARWHGVGEGACEGRLGWAQKGACEGRLEMAVARRRE